MATTQTGNAMTLADYAKNSDSKTQMGLVAALYKTESILKDAPFVTMDNFVARGQRINPGGLPSGGYGQLNETPDLVKTTPDMHEESSVLIRENVKIDMRLKNRKDLITNPIKIQTMGIMEYWARRLNDDWINNNPGTLTAPNDPKGPVGLKWRMLNVTKYQQSSDLFIDAGGIATNSTATEATANTFFGIIDKLLDYLNSSDGEGVVLYMNDDMKRAFVRLARLLKVGLTYEKDNYDRTITMYKGAKLRFIGRKTDDTTNIITNTENNIGTLNTGSVFTSIYGVRYGDENVKFWHDGLMDLVPQGPDPTGTQFYFLIDYLLGFWHGTSRDIGRIYDIGTPVG